MSPTAEEVLRSALSLSEAERASVAGILIESLEVEREPGVEEAWSKVIERRVRELRSGEVATISGSEAGERLFRGAD
jgi:Putative addiction module component